MSPVFYTTTTAATITTTTTNTNTITTTTTIYSLVFPYCYTVIYLWSVSNKAHVDAYLWGSNVDNW